jgi:hypothetical protein
LIAATSITDMEIVGIWEEAAVGGYPKIRKIPRTRARKRERAVNRLKCNSKEEGD